MIVAYYECVTHCDKYWNCLNPKKVLKIMVHNYSTLNILIIWFVEIFKFLEQQWIIISWIKHGFSYRHDPSIIYY
jgi:hypothetical protein